MNFLEPQMYYYRNVFRYSRKRHHSINEALEDQFAGVYDNYVLVDVLCSFGSIAVTAENMSSSKPEGC